MTKKGYRNKFLITIVTLSIGGYLLLTATIPDLAREGIGNAIGVMVFFLGFQLLIASAVIALIWEFFST